jgi:hypothetical protein
MKIRNFLFALAAFVLPLAGLFCVGGTGESGNSRCVIIGSIINNQGSVGKVLVKLVAEAYVPGNDTTGMIFTTLTDNQGGYRFEDIPMGHYYLNSQVLGKKLLRGPIEIAKPEVTLSVDTLCATAQVTMRLPDTGNVNTVFLKGTTKSWTVGSKTVTLDSLPSGDVLIIGFTKMSGAPQTLTSANSIQLTLALAPADTAQAAFDNPPPNIITLGVFPDTVAPVITLIGSADTTILSDTNRYVDPGVIATDNMDTATNHKVIVTGSVDKSKIGVYTLNYNVADSASNAAEMKSRIVRVIPFPPIQVGVRRLYFWVKIPTR